MTKRECIERYAALDPSTKVRFLALASHSLTIALRGDYDHTDTEFRVRLLQGANELQHHLSSELEHHHAEECKRYPDDVLIDILVEKAAYYGLLGDLAWALTRAIERTKSEQTAQGAVQARNVPAKLLPS